ncbi:hypothetical protein Tco_0231534, partial [Tanacetum coccineum]
MNDDALARLMVTEMTAADVAQRKKIIELKRREDECREQEIAAAEYRAQQEYTRTDFASWQQRIRLYCRGKDNGVNILKSIDEGPFQMGTFWETLAE